MCCVCSKSAVLTSKNPDGSIPCAERSCRTYVRNSELTPIVEKIYWQEDGAGSGFMAQVVSQPSIIVLPGLSRVFTLCGIDDRSDYADSMDAKPHSMREKRENS